MDENVGRVFNDNLADTVISKKQDDIVINGRLQDTVINDNHESTIDRGNNQICIGCHKLIASLIGGSGNADDQLYFAIGKSNAETSQIDDKLHEFLFKHRINTENGDKIEVGGTGENILTITANFSSIPSNDDVDEDGNKVSEEVYNNTWCECGIYKGDTLLNRKVHEAITKTSSIEVVRTFRFTF